MSAYRGTPRRHGLYGGRCERPGGSCIRSRFHQRTRDLFRGHRERLVISRHLVHTFPNSSLDQLVPRPTPALETSSTPSVVQCTLRLLCTLRLWCMLHLTGKTFVQTGGREGHDRLTYDLIVSSVLGPCVTRDSPTLVFPGSGGGARLLRHLNTTQLSNSGSCIVRLPDVNSHTRFGEGKGGTT